MRKKSSSGKKESREQMKCVIEQNSKIINMLDDIQKKLDLLNESYMSTAKNMEKLVEKNSSFQRRVDNLTEDISQIQQLIKIVAVNELLDEISLEKQK